MSKEVENIKVRTNRFLEKIRNFKIKNLIGEISVTTQSDADKVNEILCLFYEQVITEAKIEVLKELLSGYRLEALSVELIPVAVIQNLILELENNGKQAK